MRFPRTFSFLTLAAAMMVTACSADAPTAPRVLVTEPNSAYSSGDSQESLIQRRDALRGEQRATRDRLRPRYDELKWNWSANRKTTRFGVFGLLRHTPDEYTGDAEVIGPAGGELSVGANRLVIPRGALTQYVLITMERPMGEFVQATFGPHGLTFLKSAQLTLEYGQFPGSATAQTKIVYATDDGSQILEILSSSENRGNSTVTAPIKHFSSYMIAY